MQPGETVALVGASGSGKTTLASLSPGSTTSPAARCRVDGHDVRDLTLESLRAAIGVVAQDPHLFHESIGDNLRYAKPDATTAELDAACRGGPHPRHRSPPLPDGYDTVVGERGYRLSGGEKQRLAIARLLLKNPAVMILDEATSHLDNENEAARPGRARRGAASAAPRSSSPTACRRSATPTASWCSTTAGSSSGAPTTS